MEEPVMLQSLLVTPREEQRAVARQGLPQGAYSERSRRLHRSRLEGWRQPVKLQSLLVNPREELPVAANQCWPQGAFSDRRRALKRGRRAEPRESLKRAREVISGLF